MEYIAKNLEDVAEMFDRLAGVQQTRAEMSTTQKLEEWHKGAEFAYTDAATILRNLTIKGS